MEVSFSNKSCAEHYCTYTTSWTWPHVFIGIADFNNDDRKDIVLTPSESEGYFYHISWFEAPLNLNEHWNEHIIEDSVECVHHFVGVLDFDKDFDIDIITAEMHQGQDPDEIAIYLNRNSGNFQLKGAIATTGSHSMRVFDIDNDGDDDIFGANWSGPHQCIEVWKNISVSDSSAAWKRHVIDSNKPFRSIFITAADLDGDRNKDIITGGWWYKNPGRVNGVWKRNIIGGKLKNMAAVFDIDGDIDILTTKCFSDYIL